MRVLIFGAGALGSLLGYHLSKSCQVHLVARGDHLKVLKESGLKVIRPGGEERVQLPAHEKPPGERFNLVILTVKSYQTEEALPQLKMLLDMGTTILSLQNGLDNEKRIERYIKREGLPGGVLGGVTTLGATFIAPGVVAEGGLGRTVIGVYHRDTSGVAESTGQEFVKRMREASLKAEWSERIVREIWRKSIVNSAINTITAVLGVKNGYLLEHPSLLEVTREVVKEGCETATSAGVELQHEAVYEEVLRVIEETRGNRSSTLQDIERGRRTEVDSYLGEIINIAEKNHQGCGTLKALYHLVKAMEMRGISPLLRR